jgi:hypothetical protein
MTRSQELIERVRRIAREERNWTKSETLLQAAALELAKQHEILMESALRMEKAIHDLVKEQENAECK